MLHIILSKASIDEIKQIPFTGYTVDVIAEAVIGLAEEVKAAILGILPDEKRTSVENILLQEGS